MNSRKPNILMIMADQLTALALPVYGHPIVQAPHISTLARQGVVFENAYCNSPLCAPSRFSMMSGQLPSRISAYDNAAEFPASIPTLAHYLRALGYETTLAGKMHFVGPDQLHGFEERLTTDIYPADFGWTPDWQRPSHRFSWYHNMLSVLQAGPCLASNQIDFDEEVAFYANRKLLDLARRQPQEKRPFFLLVSFTHPHDPFTITPDYWERYNHDAIDMPAVPPIPEADLDAHSRRMRQMCAADEYEITAEHVRNARHAYYAMISYVDDKVGQLLHTLKAAGFQDDTIVLIVSDHGEMLGEHGLWYKMVFHEWSVRVPLIIFAPDRFAPRRVARHVSLVDLLPTLVDLARDDQPVTYANKIDGRSLLPLLRGEDTHKPDVAVSEYLGEGAIAPVLMMRDGRYKYIYSEPDPELLFDLEADPHERHNLAGQPDYASLCTTFRGQAQDRWTPSALREAVIASQRQRQLLARALTVGRLTSWDFQPYQDASQHYMRSHLDLNDLEYRARFPSPPAPPGND